MKKKTEGRPKLQLCKKKACGRGLLWQQQTIHLEKRGIFFSAVEQVTKRGPRL